MIERTTRKRYCKFCGELYEVPVTAEERNGVRQGYCSRVCDEADVKPKEPRARVSIRRTASTSKRRPISPASTAQREKVAERACVVCRTPHCDPAHLIPRGMLSEGQDDPRAVIPLCRAHHDEYDHAGTLDLLPYLEPWGREELAYAVERFGLRATYQQVTGGRLDDNESRRSA